MKKSIYYLKVTAGILLMPLFASLYFVDRFILIAMPWKPTDKIQDWMLSPEKATHSVYRLMVALAIYGIYSLIF
jgi:hypothetical protein